jgi:hypothetical protein
MPVLIQGFTYLFLLHGQLREIRSMRASLSTAAGMARKSVIGSPAGHSFPQTNGWTFWMYLDDGVLRQIDQLRQSYLAQRKLKIVPMS